MKIAAKLEARKDSKNVRAVPKMGTARTKTT